MRDTTEIKRLEARVCELEGEAKTAAAGAARLKSDAKHYASKLEHYRNKNMQLSAAHAATQGAVSKINSESMWKKETGTLALMLERWQVEDRAELAYRALYRSRGDDGERLTDHLSDLEGGFLDEVRRQHYHERDVEISEHLQNVFSAAKAETLRLASGVSWNVMRWWRDTWKWVWSASGRRSTRTARRASGGRCWRRIRTSRCQSRSASR